MYNAGDGVLKWHPHWLDNPRCQTYLVIDQVPEHLIESVFENPKSIDALYSTLINGGVKQPPSPYEEEYQSFHLSGTCGMRTLEAMIRHQTMQLVPGSITEKEAQYKQLMIALQESWLKSQPIEHSVDVAEWVPHINQKLAVEKQLWNLAMDVDASNKALKECCILLGQERGEGEISHYERYSLQRKVAILLSKLLRQ